MPAVVRSSTSPFILPSTKFWCGAKFLHKGFPGLAKVLLHTLIFQVNSFIASRFASLHIHSYSSYIVWRVNSLTYNFNFYTVLAIEIWMCCKMLNYNTDIHQFIDSHYIDRHIFHKQTFHKQKYIS